jgi:hypothetical protein
VSEKVIVIMRKKIKIFIGFENISSTVTDIQIYFKNKGYECYSAINSVPSVVELNTADFILQKEFDKIPYFKPRLVSIRLRSWWERRVRREFFKYCLKKFDVFIFLLNSFEVDYSDLEILKKNNKKIIFVFAGDDARWRNAASQEFEKFGLNRIPEEQDALYSQKHLKKNLERLRFAERYADAVFSRLDQGQVQLRSFFRWNMMVNPDNYRHNCFQREINPIIIHAPTDRKIKGTEYINKAFEKLKVEGILFTPILVEKTPHLDALKIFEEADIIIDQLILPGTGKFASEGLAMGKVVVSLMSYDNYPQKNPKECPIVDADINTIFEVLKELILNHPKRIELAKQGRAYAQKYLHPKYFCETVVSLVNDDKSVLPEYEPDFFRENFIPENENIEIFNDWTNFVKDEEWYKKRIAPGERAGLIF